MQLLTELGQPTGFKSKDDGVFGHCFAGMERDLRDANLPRIVKSPDLCNTLDAILVADPSIVIDHAIVPMRSLYAAAESRRDVGRRTGNLGSDGALVGTSDPSRQEAVLCEMIYQLMMTCARHQIPVLLLEFPRVVRDQQYLYTKLAPIFGFTDQDAFERAFTATSRPELVHTF